MQKKMQKIKNIFRTSESRNGSYSVGLTVLVIVIVVIVNLIIGQIPEKYRNLDVSSTKIYDISDTSRELLKNLEHKVKFTVLADKTSADERIKTFLSKYSALSSEISVEWIDPVLHPSALTDYSASENSIVVECEDTGKSKTVSFDSIIVMDTSSYYYTGSVSESEFDGEGQLTSAVNYVTNDVDAKIYLTAGHGETSLSTTIQDLMDKNNYSLEELNTVMNPEIPQDCELLLMNAPASDLTEDEQKAVEDYLGAGGKMMLLLGETNSTELPNLSAIMKDYGMEGADGYIADTQRTYQNNPYYFFPVLSVSGDMASEISTQMVLLINSHGMTLTDPARDSISVSSFMETSDSAYAVTEDSQSDAGTYVVGAVAEETIQQEDSEESSEADSAEDSEESSEAASEESSEGNSEDSSEESGTLTSRLTVISAGSLIDQQITDTFTQLENTTLFMNAVSANFEGVKNLSIEAKSLVPVYNTMQHAGLTSIIVIFVLPLAIIVIGFVVWMRRRKG